MRAAMLALVLLAAPTVAYAHSGSVLRVAVNYLPVLMALAPLCWTPLSKLLNRLRCFLKKEDR